PPPNPAAGLPGGPPAAAPFEGTLIGLDDPISQSKPRTPASISDAFVKKQATMAPKTEPGFRGFLERITSGDFYFFGLLTDAPEKGEEDTRSWLLRPSVTFPLAFATVGAAFLVLVLGGGIRERGAPTTDELDQKILPPAKVAGGDAGAAAGEAAAPAEVQPSGWYN
ncbi:hypothetical protein TeGR_g8167, partial [Tetraparma gracilis]